MKETNIGSGDNIDESLFSRMDRQQVATDIGKTAKALALSSMMLPKPKSFKPEDALSKYSQIIMEKTEEITSDIIGEEYLEFKNDEYRRYYPNVPDEWDRYVDYACMIIARLIDGAMAARFSSKEQLDVLKQRLEKINEVVGEYNLAANSVHRMANITIVKNDDDEVDKSEGGPVK